ncbi:hypothetical protein [Agromyces bracchium]|uniref:Uncharacterized protein n=1 Tax=Agromyces bracchium TaxID=88376 RepID=A0A6I3M3T1_9MICO|nr:hypothetical protein [Agromyces bracchium]MTH66827.1 hypothetical protein [Agromyces bracchium]
MTSTEELRYRRLRRRYFLGIIIPIAVGLVGAALLVFPAYTAANRPHPPYAVSYGFIALSSTALTADADASVSVTVAPLDGDESSILRLSITLDQKDVPTASTLSAVFFGPIAEQLSTCPEGDVETVEQGKLSDEEKEAVYTAMRSLQTDSSPRSDTDLAEETKDWSLKRWSKNVDFEGEPERRRSYAIQCSLETAAMWIPSSDTTRDVQVPTVAFYSGRDAIDGFDIDVTNSVRTARGDNLYYMNGYPPASRSDQEGDSFSASSTGWTADSSWARTTVDPLIARYSDNSAVANQSSLTFFLGIAAGFFVSLVGAGMVRAFDPFPSLDDAAPSGVRAPSQGPVLQPTVSAGPDSEVKRQSRGWSSRIMTRWRGLSRPRR